jgi:uncharacterized LabA/DUF88 family protein
MKAEKIICYIDGFNLYFGLRDKGWRCYYWLNVNSLCLRLLRDHQHLVLVKYFTSRITKSNPEKRKRQSTYLEALNTVNGVKIYYGKYQWTPSECRHCHVKDESPQEKMTDVQISTEMVADAFHNNYDTAIVVSGDIDLVPAIEKVRFEFPHKRVIAVFPPGRYADELRAAANGYLHINESLLKNSLLPSQIVKTDGYVLKCPETWV